MEFICNSLLFPLFRQLFLFPSLGSLTLENYTWHTKDEKYYEDCFSNLTKLVLKNPKMVGIDVEFLDKLGNWCKNLTTLTLTLYDRDSFTRVYKFKNTTSFPNAFLEKTMSLSSSFNLNFKLIHYQRQGVEGNITPELSGNVERSETCPTQTFC